jgi:lysozyme
VGGLVVSVSILSALVWFVWLPTYRPRLDDGELFGVDVSNHQGEIDWERVAADGIDFAYIKATEGGDHTDARFVQNWDAAASAGLERGAYHFFTLCTGGAAQARHFLATVPEDPQALPPAVDLELAGNCSDRPSYEDVQRELASFLDLVEAAKGTQVLLYVGDDFEAQYPVREQLERPLWHFRFLRRPDVEDWVVWQVMGFAHVSGIAGRVDLDVMRSTG